MSSFFRRLSFSPDGNILIAPSELVRYCLLLLLFVVVVVIIVVVVIVVIVFRW